MRPARMPMGFAVRGVTVPAERRERMPEIGMNMEHRDRDKNADGYKFEEYHGCVQARAGFHADDQHAHQGQNDRRGGKIYEDRVCDIMGIGRERSVQKEIRQIDMDGMQKAVEIPRPAVGHRCNRHAIFQQKIPADDPRDQLAERGIGIAIGAAAAADRPALVRHRPAPRRCRRTPATTKERTTLLGRIQKPPHARSAQKSRCR